MDIAYHPFVYRLLRFYVKYVITMCILYHIMRDYHDIVRFYSENEVVLRLKFHFWYITYCLISMKENSKLQLKCKTFNVKQISQGIQHAREISHFN